MPLLRYKIVNMILIAVFVGAGAIFFAQKWLGNEAARRLGEIQVVPQKPVVTQTIVVAAAPLRYGVEIGKQHLREIAWPEGDIPRGAFAKIADVIDGQTKRVALAPVDENELLLASKMTGPGQRGTLAAVIEPGMKAVTVRVNDVNGVAGFVLPGERVDVLITRNLDKDAAYTDVLLQNVRVLASDQLADSREDKPSLVKTVTLEANTQQAQKLTLGATVGALALALRASGQTDLEKSQRVALRDLADDARSPVAPTVTAAPQSLEQQRLTVSVTRAMKRQDYSVPSSAHVEPHEMATDLARARGKVALP
jgi:pilus assembly protein CpaB